MNKEENKYVVGAEFSDDKETLLLPYRENNIWLLVPIVGWLIPRSCYRIQTVNGGAEDNSKYKNRNINKSVWLIPLGILISEILLDLKFKVIFTLSKTLAKIIYVFFLFLTHFIIVSKIDDLVIEEKRRIISKDEKVMVRLKFASWKSVVSLMLFLYIHCMTVQMGVHALESFTIISIIKIISSEILCVLFNLGYSMFFVIKINNKIYSSDFFRELFK